MKIRITGTSDEIEMAVDTLNLTLDVRSVSQPVPAGDDEPGQVRVEVMAIDPTADVPEDAPEDEAPAPA
ncbi:hypothetical protein [Pseudofrankia sp. BMG5.37]|uniref:hypothetical protein n=1 Tax=Pseudofrankia sp. BMG5.37 TaxID=3050035 RepID=UPI002893A536|nr:hypothetical protein [Pseudofrankia sp. BMG5.37]MDT3441306.1 hypothetical protein [Pseudofrankia sp. BMG5.37]